MWLLDTNVISELRKPRPDKNVMTWIGNQSLDQLLTSVVCLAEIKNGIQAQHSVEDRERLKIWYEVSVEPMFQRQSVQVSENILLVWLRLIKQMQAKRINAPPVDLLVAATCIDLKITAVTRDVDPFVKAGASVFNPWTGEHFNGT